jgi:hypothetical protein
LLAPLAYLWLNRPGRPQPEPPVTEEDETVSEREEAPSGVETNAPLDPGVTYVTNTLTNVVFVTVTQGVSVVTQQMVVLTTNILPASNIGVILPPPRFFAPPPAGDLVAYYPFNGDAKDYSGYGNHGNVFGAFFTNGINGGGCHFSGRQFIRVPRSHTLDITGPMSISIWVRATKTTGHGSLVEKEFGFAGYAASIFSTHFRFTILAGNSRTLGLIPPGKWTHLTGVYTGTSIVLYINGKWVGQATCKRGLKLPKFNKDLYMGCWWHPVQGPQRLFRGTMDEVRIYRRALKPGEVWNLFLAK